MSGDAAPLVSVGLPVFNGERHLDEALGSLAAQDYPNLEIIVSDNASTDRTRQICEGYARRDGRIRCHRAEENRGAVWNFNRVFNLSRGGYFMWAAHDDVWEPACVSRCVAVLEANPKAVVCHPASQPITMTAGLPVGEPYIGDAFVNEADGVRKRWRAAVRKASLHAAIYGVIRRPALEKTRLFRVCLGTDAVLVAELSLYGKIVGLPSPLSRKRVPDGPEGLRSHDETLAFLGAGRPGAPRLPFRAICAEMNRGLRHADLPPGLRRRLARDTWDVYLAGGFLTVDLKCALRRALGPERYRGWSRRVRRGFGVPVSGRLP